MALVFGLYSGRSKPLTTLSNVMFPQLLFQPIVMIEITVLQSFKQYYVSTAIFSAVFAFALQNANRLR